MIEQEQKLPMLKILVVITKQEKEKAVERIFSEAGLHFSLQFRAEGTADNKWLDMLGIGSSGMTVSACIAPDCVIYRIIHELKIKLELILPGRGIAFVLPLSGVGGHVRKILSEEVYAEILKHIESEVDKVSVQSSHDLVLAVINQGFSEEVMEVAKQVGISGGTVFHARRVSPDESSKFWGITIQREKEIVAIVTGHEQKLELMRALSSQCGINSKAQGLILSLPVESVAGLSADIQITDNR